MAVQKIFITVKCKRTMKKPGVWITPQAFYRFKVSNFDLKVNLPLGSNVGYLALRIVRLTGHLCIAVIDLTHFRYDEEALCQVDRSIDIVRGYIALICHGTCIYLILNYTISPISLALNPTTSAYPSVSASSIMSVAGE